MYVHLILTLIPSAGVVLTRSRSTISQKCFGHKVLYAFIASGHSSTARCRPMLASATWLVAVRAPSRVPTPPRLSVRPKKTTHARAKHRAQARKDKKSFDETLDLERLRRLVSSNFVNLLADGSDVPAPSPAGLLAATNLQPRCTHRTRAGAPSGREGSAARGRTRGTESPPRSGTSASNHPRHR